MHWGYHRLESSCDLAGAAECRDFITVRPCSWSTSRPAWSPSRLFASSGVNCAGKPSETSSLRKWAWGRCMKRLFRRSGPGAMEHRRCRDQQALREAGFLHMHRPHLGPADYVCPEPQQPRNEICWALHRIADESGSRTGRKMTKLPRPFCANSRWNLTYR